MWNSTIHNVELLPLAHSTLDDNRPYLLAVGCKRAWISKIPLCFLSLHLTATFSKLGPACSELSDERTSYTEEGGSGLLHVFV